MKSLMLFAVLAMTSLSAQASNYPADYNIKNSCTGEGPVKVCRSLQMGYGLAALDIQYNGALRNAPGLSVWVRVNYNNGSREILVPMAVSSYGSVGVARITGGCLVGSLGGCAKPGTAEMRYLLEWAQQWGGTLNALSLDIAFVDGQGRWDNSGRAYGSYHVNFPQY